MPCELQIKTNVGPTGAVNYLVPQIGIPSGIRDFPNSGYGIHEGLPFYVYVRITDASQAEVEDYIKSDFNETSIFQDWTRRIGWDAQDIDRSLDHWTIAIFVSNPGALNTGALKMEGVEKRQPSP